jgi:hypothetical protein
MALHSLATGVIRTCMFGHLCHATLLMCPSSLLQPLTMAAPWPQLGRTITRHRATLPSHTAYDLLQHMACCSIWPAAAYGLLQPPTMATLTSSSTQATCALPQAQGGGGAAVCCAARGDRGPGAADGGAGGGGGEAAGRPAALAGSGPHGCSDGRRPAGQAGACEPR